MFPKTSKDKASTDKESNDNDAGRGEPEKSKSNDELGDQNSRLRSCSYVGPKMQVKGEIIVDESLNIDGRVEGQITSRDKKLAVGKDGQINANVKATVVEARGRIEGDIHAEDVVHLYSTALVRGTVRCSRLIVEDGAKFDGQLNMSGEEDQKPGKGKLTLASSNDANAKH